MKEEVWFVEEVSLFLVSLTLGAIPQASMYSMDGSRPLVRWFPTHRRESSVSVGQQ